MKIPPAYPSICFIYLSPARERAPFGKENVAFLISNGYCRPSLPSQARRGKIIKIYAHCNGFQMWTWIPGSSIPSLSCILWKIWRGIWAALLRIWEIKLYNLLEIPKTRTRTHYSLSHATLCWAFKEIPRHCSHLLGTLCGGISPS